MGMKWLKVYQQHWKVRKSKDKMNWLEVYEINLKMSIDENSKTGITRLLGNKCRFQ